MLRPCYLLLLFFCSACIRLGPDCGPSPSCVNEDWQTRRSEKFSSDCPDHAVWWQDFEDPTLDKLIICALEGNLSLQSAAVRIYTAKAELGIARGQLWPQIQRIFGYAVKGDLSENAPPLASLPDDLSSGAGTSKKLISTSFDIVWELDFWGRYRSGIAAANADYCESIASHDGLQVLLVADVAEAYLMLRIFQELLAIRTFNVEVQKRSLAIAEVRFRNGITSELDVQQAKAQLLSTQSLIPDLQKGLSHTVNSLCHLLGKPPGFLDELLAEGQRLPSGPEGMALGFPADLLRCRPDIREAEFRVLAQGERIGVSKANLYPNFALAGTLGFSATTFSKLLNGNSFTWTAGPLFKWDILNYGRLKNAVRVEDARYQEALLAYQDRVLQAQKEVEDGIVAFAKSKQQSGLMIEVVSAAERALELALTQYREGEADFTRVLRAQDEVLQAQTMEVESRSAVATSLVQLYKSLGGGQCRVSDHVLWPETREQMCERTDWGCMLEEEVE